MKDDLFVLIEAGRSNFTAVEHMIGDFFLEVNKPQTIHEVARQLSVSKASITRFCKKIGLNNYKELIFLYKTSLWQKQQQGQLVSRVLTSYYNLVRRSEETYAAQDIQAVCELIEQHKIIHFFGKGFNSYVGHDFQFKFSRVGKYVRIVSDERSMQLSAASAETGELVVAATLRGDDEALAQALNTLKKREVPIILLTANKCSPLIKLANVTLITAGFTREEAVGNISPQVPMLIQLDMVYESYLHLYTDTIKKWKASEQILHREVEDV